MNTIIPAWFLVTTLLPYPLPFASQDLCETASKRFMETQRLGYTYACVRTGYPIDE